jgi:hypothetical protein
MEREPTIVDLFERLDRERQAADRHYNEALTALDRALPTRTELPAAPAFHDSSQMRVVAPPFEAQQQFNAAVVEHLNRNIAVHERATQAAAELVEAARRRLEAVTRFEWLLLQLLQTHHGVRGHEGPQQRRP